MHRHSARVVRYAGGALIAAVVSPWLGGVASATTIPEPYNAAINAGNVPTTAGPYDNPDSCSTEFAGKADSSDGWLFVADPSNFTAFEAIFDEGTFVLGGSSNPAGTSATFTKADSHLAVITPAGWRLTQAYATLDGEKDFFTLSHTCAGTPPEQTTPASGSIAGDCTNVNVHMDGGTDGGSFDISPAGTSAVIHDHVDGGATKDEPLTVDADHPTVTLFLDEEQIGTFTRSTDCDQVESTTDPAVSFGNACASGISVTLTNMQVDDTTTDPVTFTVVTPSGNTRHVTVRADQIVKLAFKVKEDTTGTVTVSAPGLSKTSHSYAKNCTKVLGEKVVKTPKTPKPPAVQGEQAQLPFTGMPTGLAALLGALMLAMGGGLSVLGRRREAEVSAG